MTTQDATTALAERAAATSATWPAHDPADPCERCHKPIGTADRRLARWELGGQQVIWRVCAACDGAFLDWFWLRRPAGPLSGTE